MLSSAESADLNITLSRVYLSLDDQGRAVCPYCSTVYQLEDTAVKALNGWIHGTYQSAVGNGLCAVAVQFMSCLCWGVHHTHAFQQPFLLAVAGLATGLGSLIYLWIDRPSERHLILALGLSAGAMLYVSFAELLHSAVDTWALCRPMCFFCRFWSCGC